LLGFYRPSNQVPPGTKEILTWTERPPARPTLLINPRLQPGEPRISKKSIPSAARQARSLEPTPTNLTSSSIQTRNLFPRDFGLM
jgi:hypothetical protein